MTSTTSISAPAQATVPSAARALSYGVAGGLVGGMVFGMMMQMMGAIPMIAALVGSSSVAVGWAVHLAISAVIGAVFGLLLTGRRLSTGAYAGTGLAYGMLWWVLGPLVLMPARMGMPLFQVSSTVWQSLMGHMVYGVALGVVTALLVRRGTDA